MRAFKQAGNKFSKWTLERDGQAVLEEGEANVLIGAAIGLDLAAGIQQPAKPAKTPKAVALVEAKQPKAPKANKPSRQVETNAEADAKPGWTMDDAE